MVREGPSFLPSLLLCTRSSVCCCWLVVDAATVRPAARCCCTLSTKTLPTPLFACPLYSLARNPISHTALYYRLPSSMLLFLSYSTTWTFFQSYSHEPIELAERDSCWLNVYFILLLLLFLDDDDAVPQLVRSARQTVGRPNRVSETYSTPSQELEHTGTPVSGLLNC